MTRFLAFRFFTATCLLVGAAHAEPGSHGGGKATPGTGQGGGDNVVVPAAAGPLKPPKFECEIKGDKNPILKIIAPDPRTDQALVKEIILKGLKGEAFVMNEDTSGLTMSDYLKWAKIPDGDKDKSRYSIHNDGLIPGLFDSEEKYVSFFRMMGDAKKLASLPKPEKKADQASLAAFAQQKDNQLTNLKLFAVEELKSNSFKREGWAAMKRPLTDKGAEQVAKSIDLLLTKREDPKAWAAAVKEQSATPAWKSNDNWLTLLREVADAYGTMTESKYTALRKLPSLDTYKALIKDPASIEKENAFGEAIIYGYGIRKSQDQLVENYCKAIKENKPLYFMANDLYALTIFEALKAEVGGKIPLQFRQQGHDFEIKNGEIVDVTPFPKPKVIDGSFDPANPPKDPPKPPPGTKPEPAPAPAPPVKPPPKRENGPASEKP